MEVYVAVRVGVRVRVRDPNPVRGLHQLLPEADDRRHEVRGNRQLHSSVPRPAVLELSRQGRAVHLRAGADHAVPVGGDGSGFGFHEAARREVLPHHHVPAVRGAGRGVDFGVGLHVRREIRSGRLPERLAGHEPRRAEPKRAARFDRQHRDVGVHRLQHADLLQLAVHDPALAVRGRQH